MKWIFYRTENKVNGKYYLGIHGSNNIESDKYLGSGVLLREAIRKYGRVNFTRTILKEFDTEYEARLYEAEQITDTVLKDSNNYNIALGGGGGSKNSKHFYILGGKHYIVNENAVAKFIEKYPDAIQGKPKDCLQKYVKGRKSIHKGTENKRVRPEELAEYLENGWLEGESEDRVQRNSISKKGFKIMTKDNRAFHIKLKDVDDKLQEGYVLGPPEWMNRKQGDKHKGLIKVHNGRETRFISKEQLPEFIQNGYKQGSSPECIEARRQVKLGRKTIHRNTEERSVYPEELEQYLSEGWSLGRVKDNIVKAGLATRSKNYSSKIKEEAALRRVIYRDSIQFRCWWKENAGKYANRPQYAVCHFLEEIHRTKSEFVEDMKNKGETI